jgi:SAM-dependent methyltransferase
MGEPTDRWLESELSDLTVDAVQRRGLSELAEGLDRAAASRMGLLLPWLVALRGNPAPESLPFRLVGPEALAAALRQARWQSQTEPLLLAVRRELRLQRLCEESDEQTFCDTFLDSTEDAVAMLDAIRDGTALRVGRRMASLLPWLYELRADAAPLRSPEHEAAASAVALVSRPLLDHLSDRVLARKLMPLESGQWVQEGEGLHAAQVVEVCRLLGRVREAGLLPCLRGALVHLDIAKVRENASLSIHNVAAMEMLRHETPPGFATPGLLQRFTAFRERPHLTRLCESLVGVHGLVGQHLRGETTAELIEPWVHVIRSLDLTALDHELGRLVGGEELRRRAFELLLLVDLCDTSGVREGLMTAGLWERFGRVHSALWARCASGEEPSFPSDRLTMLDDPSPMDRDPHEAIVDRLVRRLTRLRRDRVAQGEPPEKIGQVLRSLSPQVLERFAGLFGTCQLWYCERATADLTVEGQLRLLALAMRRAEIDPTLDQTRAYHVNFRPLMNQLWTDGRIDTYRVRLLEALLEPLSLESVLTSDESVDLLMPTDAGRNDLGTFRGHIGAEPCVEVRFEPSIEAQALLTLLPIYERKRPAAFHATLKALCDLYGLRKDEYDRVNNEASYLASMNAARNDKSRMLDHVVPGLVVEVGPGGGVVLDLLEERFPGSEIVGLDVSEMVVAALERKKAVEGRRWRVVRGDAFELPKLFGEGAVSSVIFCSILHEIYSYVPWPTGPDGKRERFRLGSVEAMLRAAFRCLRPGGRVVIRDGVQPPPGRRIIRFKQPDGAATLELFAKEFEGRPIRFEWLAPELARMSAEDAMEFLYTYTWGPEAFPYEVREQYGVLPLEEYRRSLVRWLGDADPGFRPRLVEIPDDLASYLQPGYPQALSPRVDLYEGDVESLDNLEPVRLPDSNCLLVVEKEVVAPGV